MGEMNHRPQRDSIPRCANLLLLLLLAVLAVSSATAQIRAAADDKAE
jgi:hypothetical protein